MGYSLPAAKREFLGNFTDPQYRRRKRDCAGEGTGVDILYRHELRDTYFEELYEWAQIIGSSCERDIGDPEDAGPHTSTTVVA